MMLSLQTLLERAGAFRAVREAAVPGSRQAVTGLVGSARSALVATLFRRTRRTILVVTAGARQADDYDDDLHALVETPEDALGPPVKLFPALPTLLYDDVGVDRQLVGQRLEALEALLHGEPSILIAPLGAVLHRTVPVSAMVGGDLSLEVGQELSPEPLLEHLESLGYQRHDPVLTPGQCALRGGIVDVYPMTSPQPVRVEFWGDEIESIRFFDVATQRSTLPQQRFTVTVSRETIRSKAIDANVLAEISRTCELQASRLEKAGRRLEAKRLRGKVADDIRKLESHEPFDGGDHYLPFLYDEVATIIDYLPPDAMVVVDEPEALASRAEALAKEIDETYRAKISAGAVLSLPAPLFSYHDRKNPLWKRFAAIDLQDAVDGADAVFETQPLHTFDGDLTAVAAAIKSWRAAGQRVYCATHQTGRLQQIFVSRGIPDAQQPEFDNLPAPGELRLVEQRLTRGFTAPSVEVVVLTDNEVFGWRRTKGHRGRSSVRRGSAALDSLTELTPGELIVHVHHGIGLYAGLVTRVVAGIQRDYLQVDYANKDRLFVPVTELDSLQRYIGPEGFEPTLNGLGDSRWRRSKSKAKEKAEAVARDLLELYARRSIERGRAFSADGVTQHEVEAAFIYEETRDQLQAIREVKADMENKQPMDRLLCGDVGFGKTEVAVRAAFKAVADGCQVAVLVPTTVLAQQHYGTFSERLSAFGVEVDVISRFRSKSEQAEVLEKLHQGKVQVVVGTHRLLSRDIKFDNLGLLIIDEEQRFGVRHKERIKELRLGVDVLTMTATPIPRTLNQALVGVRDLSMLQEAPAGRLPVLVRVEEREDELMRDAILRELNRDGQVYFLHNRVRSIERAATRLRRLVPTARIGIGHGQMHEDELEEVMVEMYAGRYDVLVATTIIENGLDIPNVNTIIVDDCDHFGLAQLYQLIGRVGRRDRQAYAILQHRQHGTMTADAHRRLEAILELSDLGSGLDISLRDLEIRGAGNLLGTRQSGFMEEIGYELYTQLLSDALRILRGESADELRGIAAEIDLPVQANLPSHYLRDERQRIELYRRLAAAREQSLVNELEAEVRDRFGRLPEAAENLFRVVRIRLEAQAAGVQSVKVVGGRKLVAEFSDDRLDRREMRTLARAIGRAAQRHRTPKLELTPEALSGDLREPTSWSYLAGAEAVLSVMVEARRDIAVAQP